MKRSYFGLLIGLILISCSGETEKTADNGAEERVVVHDSLDSAVVEIPVLQEPDVLEKLSITDFFATTDSVIAHFSDVYDTIQSTRSIIPERFTSASSRKIVLRRKQPVEVADSIEETPEAYIWVFDYSDTTQMKLVLRNWFMEFGDSRTEIRIGEPTEIKGKPSVVVLGETQMVVLQTDCKNYQSFIWDNLITSFRNAFYRKGRLLVVDCNGSLRWY